jgi:protein arginine N-methyltransferase 3
MAQTVSAGFDLSAMADGVYDEAIVDIVGPDTMVSEPCVIKVRYVSILDIKY